MQVIVILLTILSLGTLFGFFYKPKWGAWCYLIYMFLAPYLYIGGFIIYARTLFFIFFIFFLLKIHKKLKKRDYAPFMPFIMLLGCSSLFVLTAENMSFSFDAWITNVSPFFYILYLYGVMKTNPKSIKTFKWTLFGIMTAIMIYGLFLTLMPGVNPYLMITQPLFGGEFNEAYALGRSGLDNGSKLVLNEGRMFGRISSVFTHPMLYGLNLGLFFIYILYLLKNKPKILFIFSLFIIIAILTSGVRTSIGALLFTIIIILLFLRKYKFFFVFFLGFLIFIYILPLISPGMGEYVMSIFSQEESTLKGSSIDMRLEQLEGCFEIVQNDLLLGKGYGWSKWYNATFGTHPTALWFESISFSTLVNTGLLGIILWIIFGIKYHKYVKHNIVNPALQIVLLTLFVYFITFCMITGEFGLTYFYVFYTIIICLNDEIKDKYGTVQRFQKY